MKLNTNREIIIKDDKILKLNNLLVRPILADDTDMNKTLMMIDSYIKANSLTTYGPMILYSGIKNEMLMREPKLTMKIMFQLSSVEPKIIPPYEHIPIIRLGPCMFSRFVGDEQNLQFAQSKIGVYAYEHNIKLKSENYTIFVDKKDDISTIDIFIPIAEKREE